MGGSHADNWCDEDGPKKGLNIIRGSDKDFTAIITIAGGCNSGQPFDLTGASEIKALFKNADGCHVN